MCAIANIRSDQFGLSWYGSAVPTAKVIQHDYIVAGIHKFSRNSSADVTGAARDQNFHSSAAIDQALRPRNKFRVIKIVLLISQSDNRINPGGAACRNKCSQ